MDNIINCTVIPFAFPFIYFSNNSFFIKKTLDVSFGDYTDKMFGGREFVPHASISLKDKQISYSLRYEDDCYFLDESHASEIPQTHYNIFYEDEDFYSFVVFVTNKICNHLAEDMYINRHFEISEYGTLTFKG